MAVLFHIEVSDQGAIDLAPKGNKLSIMVSNIPSGGSVVDITPNQATDLANCLLKWARVKCFEIDPLADVNAFYVKPPGERYGESYLSPGWYWGPRQAGVHGPYDTKGEALVAARDWKKWTE